MKHEHRWKRVWSAFVARYVLNGLGFVGRNPKEHRLEVYRCRCGEMGYPV